MKSVSRSPRTAAAPGKRSAGFTLLELLVVVAVIAVVSLIATGTLLNALNRAKQKVTMSDLHAIATAIEMYSLDNSNYPTASDVSTLSGTLETSYIRQMPPRDGWGRDFVVSATTGEYTVGSGGKDGGGLTYTGGPTQSFDDAIILVNGTFVQWPEGIQQ
ncbi:MAG: prepilin-type N-terminal cleavage/methylation domain-containing protein [bacterium]|nr:prepilin-type N-terminal cleavage/methylation domain-containing protein [bacterium]